MFLHAEPTVPTLAVYDSSSVAAPTVIIHPTPADPASLTNGEGKQEPLQWSTGLFSGLCADPGGCHACAFAMIAPSFLFSVVAEHEDERELPYVGGRSGVACLSHFLLGGCFTCGSAFLCFFPSLFSATHVVHTGIRTAIRKRRGIPGSELRDCLTVYCCEPCALIQERREQINSMGGTAQGGGTEDVFLTMPGFFSYGMNHMNQMYGSQNERRPPPSVVQAGLPYGRAQPVQGQVPGPLGQVLQVPNDGQ
jgi:Cys-rich protein (TIGR01571 family)